MEEAFSWIDVEAGWCYLVLLLFGLYIGVGSVEQGELKAVPGRWSFAETYLLVLAQAALPLLLFYALDAAGTVHDTSLVAALVVAFTYRTILGGAPDQAYKPPSWLSGFYLPFLQWVTRVSKAIQDYQVERDERFHAVVQRRVAINPALAKQLESYAYVAVPEATAQLQADLAALGATAPPALRAKAALGYMVRTPILATRLFARRLISLGDWLKVVSTVSNFLQVFLPALVFAFFVYLLVPGPQLQAQLSDVLRSFRDHGELDERQLRYYTWRLTKAHNTARDVRRAVDFFKDHSRRGTPLTHAGCPRIVVWGGVDASSVTVHPAVARPDVLEHLARVLGSPGLDPSKADTLIAIFLEDRWAEPAALCASVRRLVPALRSPEEDVRTRLVGAIDLALQSLPTALVPPLASATAFEAPPPLPKKPTVIETEQRIVFYERALARACRVTP